MEHKKVFAAMSGGVDSSVAAALLVEQGYSVIGVTMRLYDGAGGASSLKSCCGFGPAFDARQVADKLGINHMILDYRSIFKKGVIDPFVDSYLSGRTPNPCIMCNSVLKFGHLLRTALSMGFDAVATGHYARIVNKALLRGVDVNKDQSYFLYELSRSNICRVIFPLGEMTKVDTRKIAKELQLPVHDKQESQDICFVNGGEYRDFLEQTTAITAARGFMYNTAGDVIGEHEGLHRYTIGQRKGLGPLGQRSFVVDIDIKRNALIVGSKEELYCNGLEIVSPTFCRLVPGEGDSFKARLRHRGELRDVVIEKLLLPECVRLRFVEPSEGAAPGQSVVLYNGEEVVGGGIISSILRKT